MDRYDDNEEYTSPAEYVVIAAGFVAILIGAWGLIVSVTASLAALAPAVTPELGATPVFDILGGDTPSGITFLYLAYRGIGGSALLTGAFWILQRQVRGHSAVRWLLGIDVFVFLTLLLIWSARDVHPPYEGFVIELTLTFLKIIVLIVLAHPETRNVLARPNFPNTETNP